MRAPLEVAVGLDLGAVLDGDAGTEEDVRLDDDIAADLGVVGKPDGLRRDQRRALAHHGEARALLEDRLGGGELLARVDAQHIVFAARDDRGARAARTRDLDSVGEVEFALGVLVADARQHAEQIVDPEGHDAGIAQPHAAFLGAGVLVLADGIQPSLAVRE